MYHSILSLIKKARPGCITVAGGAHVTVCPREILDDSNCDFILMGEAEESFKEFLMCMDEKRSFGSVDGLGWKENGKTHINEKKKWIRDLDALPLPAYDIMGIAKYFGLQSSHGLRHRARCMPVITSRGCPAKCTFCSAHRVWGNNYRFRSVDNVLDEMKVLKDRYGIEELMFEDDNVTANPKRAKELFSRMHDEALGFVWDTPNGIGVWSMDEEMIDLMKRSGCIKLNFPVESGSQRVLDNVIKKPIKLQKVKQLIMHCKKIGLDHNIFLVIGMPGEAIKDIRASFRFAAECGCFEPHISVATPYPGTPLFEECAQNKLFAREFRLEDLFTKSFMISTPDWSESKLEKSLSDGLVCLKIKSLLADPKKSLRRLARAMKRPSVIAGFLRDTAAVFLDFTSYRGAQQKQEQDITNAAQGKR